MLSHGRNQNRFRDIKKTPVKITANRRRIFYEIGHCCHQIRVLGRFSTHWLSRFKDQFLHDLLSFLLIDQDKAFLYFLKIILNIHNFHYLRRHKPVASGSIPALYTSNFKWNYFPIQKCQHPVNRSHKRKTHTPPPHGFGPGYVSNEFWQDLCQDFSSRPPWNLALNKQVLPFGRL